MINQTSFGGDALYLSSASHVEETIAAPHIDPAHADDPIAALAAEAEHEADDYATEEHASEEHGGGHDFPLWVIWAPFVAMLSGFGAAFFHYMRGGDPLRPGLLKEGGMIYAFLKNKWYFDELYRFLFLRPAQRIGRFLWKVGDGKIIDGFGPDGISGLAGLGSRLIVKVQSGYIYHYAFAMLIGIAVILFLVRMGGVS